MKITLNHKKFYISKKLVLKSSIWSKEERSKVCIHSLINSQLKKERFSISHYQKQSLLFRIKKKQLNSKRVDLVRGLIKLYKDDRDHDHLVPFLESILNKIV